jgi:hypothetical protein
MYLILLPEIRVVQQNAWASFFVGDKTAATPNWLPLLPKELGTHDSQNATRVDNSLNKSWMNAQARGTPKLGALAHSAFLDSIDPYC